MGTHTTIVQKQLFLFKDHQYPCAEPFYFRGLTDPLKLDFAGKLLIFLGKS